MIDLRKISVILLGFMIFLSGCAANYERGLFLTENPLLNEKWAQENVNSSKSTSTDIITEQWANSLHSRANSHTIGRDECITCHDGYAFANQITEAAQLPASTGQDCFACHAGHGRELKEAGMLNIPIKENYEAGLGAVCSSCHHGNNVPDITNARRAYPHYGPQADVISGFGGIRTSSDLQFYNTYGHISMENSCVDCHMPVNKSGFRPHSFTMQPEYAELVCASCHQDATDFNLEAKADYDGDGKVEGIQDEVSGLLDILEKAIIEELDGGSFEPSKGVINYYDKNGNPISSVPDKLYLASYNYLLIQNDGSKGVHNPLFAVQLLQYSYKELTGREVPNAYKFQ